MTIDTPHDPYRKDIRSFSYDDPYAPYLNDDLLTTLVTLCVQRQIAYERMFRDLKERYSTRGFIKEFCTVKVAGPRRSGHTTAIVNCAGKVYPDNHLIIVPYGGTEDQIGPLARDMEIDNLNVVAWNGSGSYPRISDLDLELGVVFVDCSWAYSSGAIDRIIKLTYPYRVGPYVLALIQ